MPQSQIIRSPVDVSAVRWVTRFHTSVTNRDRSPSDQRTTYFSAHRFRAWPMFARSTGNLVASGGVRINFKSYLIFSRRRAREGNDLRSNRDRTINVLLSQGRSSDIGFIVRVLWRAPSGDCQPLCGGPPTIRRSPANVYFHEKYLDFCR